MYRVSLRGGQGGWLGGTFVIPDLGDRCVCCDSATADVVEYDPSVDYQALGLVRVPLCVGCRSHVGRYALWRPLLTTLALVFGFVELTFAIGFGRMNHLAFALLAIGAGVAVPSLLRRRRIAAARHGHHREFAFVARPGDVELRTTNRRLVELLLAQGGALVD